MKVGLEEIHVRVVAFLCILGSVMGGTCVQTGSCSCESSDGIIDLHSVARHDGTARFVITSSGRRDSWSQDEDPETSYYYNPCYGFNVGASTPSYPGCTDVAVCLYRDPRYEDIGQQQHAVFGYSPHQQAVYIHYTTTVTNLSSTVYLRCRPDGEDSLKYEGLHEHTHNFTLYSSCACPNGCVRGIALSVGTILCLVILCLIVMYLGVGVLYRKVVFSATGTQLLPNLPFWTSLPGLIKDGYLFFISPCLGPTVSYEQL